MRHLYEPAAYRPEVNSYWQTTASPLRWPELKADRTADTLIIGGGYTGLNCALELAELGHDPQSIVILEARQPGWGASGRNGGFCCIGGSKLPVNKQLARFGEAETLRYFKEQCASIESVRENLTRYGIDADPHSRGETQLAHRESEIAGLEAEKEQMEALFGIGCRLIEKSALAGEGLASPEFHGALNMPLGFALNPMKYLAGLVRAATGAGIAGFGDTPAIAVKRDGGRWRVSTPGGTVSAESLVIATNGYSSEDLPRWLSGRLLPVLSNILLSRPLTAGELAAQGWTSNQMSHDTRNLLHYFRLMPPANGESGPRMLFGMRGGTSADDATMAAMHRRIRADFDRFFPAWRQVETPYFWAGLVCLNRNLVSYTGPIPGMPNAWASLAYHGSGVAMGSHCGRLAGRMIAGDLAPEAIPAIMRRVPGRFPFPAFRKTYLAAAYRWYEWQEH